MGNLDQANSLNDSVSNEDQRSKLHGLPVNENQADHSSELTVVEGHTSGNAGNTPGSKQTIQTSGQSSVRHRMPLNSDPKTRLETLHSFDSWIDDLVEFQETVLPKSNTGNLTIADALFKLQANKDIPLIQLPYFDGNALSYTDFVDQFKIHIHDKVHLADDTRIIQLRMHVTKKVKLNEQSPVLDQRTEERQIPSAKQLLSGQEETLFFGKEPPEGQGKGQNVRRCSNGV